MALLRVFFDSISQPSRSVLLLLKQNKVPFKPEIINIAKGGNLTNEDFASASPAKAVPAIIDGDFKLCESESIMKYICEKYHLADHWYPKDIEKRAKIDEYLAWHHTNLRIGATDVVWAKAFYPFVLGKPVDEKKAQRGLKRLSKCFKIFDDYFLKKTPFISSQEISIADLMAICEFSQLEFVEKNYVELTPPIEKWIFNCKQELGNNYDDVHALLYKMVSKLHPDAKL